MVRNITNFVGKSSVVFGKELRSLGMAVRMAFGWTYRYTVKFKCWTYVVIDVLYVIEKTWCHIWTYFPGDMTPKQITCKFEMIC